MGAPCAVTSDLSALRLPGSGDASHWRAAIVNATDGGAPTLAPVRERAAAAATFVREAMRDRQASLGLVCVSVDDAMCSWIAAPSADAGVITAAVRRRGAEWDRDTTGESVQPLTGPVKRSGLTAFRPKSDEAERSPGAHMTVLEAVDGALRLWLDELDRRGERPTSVLTLWHALAAVWAESPEPSDGDEAELIGVLFREREDRLVWAWGAAGALIAGGGVRQATSTDEGHDDGASAPGPQVDDVSGRLSLDWLTWTAQVGRAPQRIVVVAPDAQSLAESLEKRWPGASISAAEEADPVGALLDRLQESDRPPAQDDPRRSLLSATRRAARAHRRLIRVTSLALLILAFGVGALGWRARQTASAFRLEADRTAAQFQQIVVGAAPEFANNPMAAQNPRQTLQSLLAQLQDANPPITEPDQPLPIKPELERFLMIIAGVEGAELESVSIRDRNASATVFTDEVLIGEELLNALRDSDGALRWQGNYTARGSRFSWQLSALWEDDR